MSERPETSRFQPAAPPHLRVLVADDDPGSCRFLGDGLRSLGATVEACVDGKTALARARAGNFDLLLLDCHMPDGGALRILTQLHADTPASPPESAAVATTAELAPVDRRNLLAAGFSEVLLKPCALADLQHVLSFAHTDPQCVLDDGAALYSSGDPDTMHALRVLLRDELALLQRELDGLSQDLATFADRLHRLRSSCGFCGATVLAHRTALMQQQLSRDGATPAALAAFRRAILATLQALKD